MNITLLGDFFLLQPALSPIAWALIEYKADARSTIDTVMLRIFHILSL